MLSRYKILLGRQGLSLRVSKYLNTEYLAQTVLTLSYEEIQSPHHIGTWTLGELEAIGQSYECRPCLRIPSADSEALRATRRSLHELQSILLVGQKGMNPI